MRILGADVRPVPVAPFTSPQNFNLLAQAYAAEEPATRFWTDQFDNRANMLSHYESTGPELHAQTQGCAGMICL